MLGEARCILDSTPLVDARALVEDKGNCSIPGGFQHWVPQALLVKAVVPL